ncbi:MAG TPA: UTP--glucose-1-phosphate uridylyltransferase [Solirubrobacteraceae bacterium]|nr:UTP--glucose-1-phosphate uridylyltransferase [Solirubrobacteraceae bacterium]
MSSERDPVAVAAVKMRAAGQTDEAIRTFSSALERVRSGAQTRIPSADLEPAAGVPALAELPDADPAEALADVAMIKLNGGLATSMGLHQPKSLVEAREGRSFLEIIIGQTLALRRRCGVRLPLVLMNSDATRQPTAEAMAEHPEIALDGLPLDFLQSMVPKLDAETMLPASWPEDPGLEWNPPGHGDVYAALRGSGMLATLLEHGFRYAMISNADNLGSMVDARIAAHMARERIPFLMEVVQGTEADRKGGHIARRRRDGQLVLRETAQTPEDDQESFRDYRRWRYYNTNSLWVDLPALEDILSGGGLELPVIVNRKTVDPRDASSPPVLQLESAMGAAIASFAQASLLLVPRTRFAPVKTTDDLLVLRSDVYTLDEDCRVLPLAERASALPYVELDSRYYKLLDEFERRFPEGPPSLREAERLVVHGDVTFGRGVSVRGNVELDADRPERLADGTVLGDG